MAMAKFYYKRVINDVMKIEEVPDLWRQKVEDLLESQCKRVKATIEIWQLLPLSKGVKYSHNKCQKCIVLC